MCTVVNKDGYMIVDVGDGAQMTCPTHDLEWRLRYQNTDNVHLVAAGVVESFRYLLLDCSQKEAIRRMKIMRDEMRKARRKE